jgi:anti-sigma-K factor RskA
MTERLDQVMAYLDGELDADARAAFEADMAADPELAAEVAAHRGLAASLKAAYDPVLDEPVPLRFTLAAQAANDAPRPRRAMTWAAVAASLVVGVFVGRMALAPQAPVAVGAEVPARTELAQALDHRLAAEPGVVRIGLTFRDAGGRYCRTFQSGSDKLAGLACRSAKAWRVETATAWAPAATPTYRTAGSDTPAAVLAAVDGALSGQVFDAAQEKAARDGGWKP